MVSCLFIVLSSLMLVPVELLELTSSFLSSSLAGAGPNPKMPQVELSFGEFRGPSLISTFFFLVLHILTMCDPSYGGQR